MDGEMHPGRMDGHRTLAEHLVWAIESHRHHWQLEHGSDGEGSLLEAMEVAVAAARAFREDHHRLAVLQGVHCLTHGVDDALCTRFIYPDLS